MHSEKLPIYLDNNATTAIDPEVLQAMLPYLTSVYGNPASDSHAFGWTASNAVKNARAAIAATLNAAHARDVIFTSGATESINLAILGLFNPQGNHPEHIITSMIEHKAVLDACNKLADQGKSITYLRPGTDGVIPTEALRCAITDKTRLVSIMAANNETGTLQNISEIGRICAERQILFHTDATQALGKIDLDVQRMNISMASFSAHKIYGPKGVGALYINTADPRIALAPIIVGGGHERGLRSGTLNVPGIVGFARAAELATTHISSEPARLSELRDRLRTRLLSAVPAARVNGHPTECLPGVLSISFAGIDASSLLLELPDTRFSAFQMTGICSSPILLKLFVDQGDHPLEAAFAGVAILAMVASGFLLLSGISVPPTRHNTRFQPWLTKLSVLVGGSAIRPIVMVGLGGAVFSGMMAFQGSLTEGTRSSPSVFFGVHAATAVAARLLLARRLSTWHRNPLMAVLLALLIAGLLCLLGMPLHPAFHIASALLTGAGYGLLYPVIQAWAVNSSKAEDRHAALTWFVISYFVGIFGFPAVGGWLLVASGKTLFIATLIALAALELATAFIGAQPRGNNRTQ